MNDLINSGLILNCAIHLIQTAGIYISFQCALREEEGREKKKKRRKESV